MRRAFEPRPYQRIALDYLHETPRANLWAGMGLGKTITCLTLLDAQYNVGSETAPTLVLAPLRVARETWPTETAKWQHLQGLEVVSITGTASERRQALMRDVPVYVTNYDNLPWLREHLGDRWPFAQVVADESTRLKSFRTRQGGKRVRALADVAHTDIKRWINLTGTPSPNGLEDVWGQQWFIDAGQRLGRTFSAFQGRWFRPIKKSQWHQWVPQPNAQAEIQERLADCTLTIDPRDWFDLRQPIVNVIEVELPAAARTLYQQMETEFFAEIDGQEIEALSTAAKSQKLLQLANGAIYTDDAGTWKEIHDAKLSALASVVEEAGGTPVLVAYHFKSDLRRLQKAFPAGRALDADPATIGDWNAGKIPVLFAHPASAGHGLNLQDGGNILAFFSHWWDLEQHDQIIERIGPVRQLQSGHDRPVFVHYITARNTIDQVVMERRDGKRTVQELLMDYMKGKQ